MLVIGATRILRPAVIELAAAGVEVVAVARTEADLARLATASAHIRPWVLDYHDLDALRTTRQFSSAVVYTPNAPSGFEGVLRAAVAGPVVQLLTSSAAAERQDQPFSFAPLTSPPPPWCRVVLGWTAERSWHEPEAISAAALAALRDGRDRLLGLVRPWSDRPVDERPPAMTEEHV